MASTNSTLRTDIKTPLDANDAINHTRNMIEFLQDTLTLQGELPEHLNVNGLYHVFEDIKDRLADASLMLDNKRKIETTPKMVDVSEIQKHFDQIFFSLNGLKEQSTHSQIEAKQVEAIEDIVSNAREGVFAAAGILN